MTTDQSQHLATNTIEEINAAGALQKGRPHPALLRIQQSFDTQSAIPGPFTNTYQTPFESTVKSGPPPYFPYPTNAQLNKAQLSKSQLQALRAAAPGVTKPGRMTRASLTPTIRKYFEDNGNEWAGSWSIFNNEKYTVKYKSETAKKGSGTIYLMQEHSTKLATERSLIWFNLECSKTASLTIMAGFIGVGSTSTTYFNCIAVGKL